MPQDFNLIVNGERRSTRTDAERPLLDVLREDLKLTGTKYGCGEGECGACTVLLDGVPMRSCITSVGEVGTDPIQTIEGLAGDAALHEVQQAFLDHEAMQCGYCVPGHIMTAVALSRDKPNTIILHSRQDDVILFSDSKELLANSGLPPETLVEVGNDHRLADSEPLNAMLDACFKACLPEWTDEQKELLQREWDALCYSAAMRWITASKDPGWQIVHGTVFSGELERRIEHAWCERGDVVVDLAMPIEVRVIDRETYYRTIKPEISKVYSSEDALVLSIRNGHHGPWDESEQLKE